MHTQSTCVPCLSRSDWLMLFDSNGGYRGMMGTDATAVFCREATLTPRIHLVSSSDYKSVITQIIALNRKFLQRQRIFTTNGRFTVLKCVSRHFITIQ